MLQSPFKGSGVLFPGVANMTALGNMISWQRLEYDFNFHKQDFHTNILTLVLSEGKSILKVIAFLTRKIVYFLSHS